MNKYNHPETTTAQSSFPSSSSPSILRRPSDAPLHSHLDHDQRVAAIALHEAEHDEEDISNRMDVDKRTIHDWIKRYPTDTSLSDHKRSGRPPLINDNDRSSIIRLSMEIGEDSKKKYSTVKAIQNIMEITCSPRTISRVLAKAGIFGRVRRKSIPLTVEHCADRLSFAKAFEDWTADDWSKVLFADETIFPSVFAGQQWCLRWKNEEMLPEN
jgi:transposase